MPRCPGCTSSTGGTRPIASAVTVDRSGSLPRDRFLGYTQTHDQVGNRALGERLSHLTAMDGVQVASALVLLGPFVPLIFQGEEWAASTPFLYFTDHDDPEVAEAVRAGRRAEFAAFDRAPDRVPDPQDPSTFRRSVLDWDERIRSPHADVLRWYQSLLALRRQIPCLRDPRPDSTSVELDEAAGWLCMDRGEVVVAVSTGALPVRVPLPRSGLALVVTSDASASIEDATLSLGPRRAAVLVDQGTLDAMPSPPELVVVEPVWTPAGS